MKKKIAMVVEELEKETRSYFHGKYNYQRKINAEI